MVTALKKALAAIAACRNAIKLRPTLGVSYYGLALLLRQDGNRSAAKEFRQSELLQKSEPQQVRMPKGNLAQGAAPEAPSLSVQVQPSKFATGQPH